VEAVFFRNFSVPAGLKVVGRAEIVCRIFVFDQSRRFPFPLSHWEMTMMRSLRFVSVVVVSLAAIAATDSAWAQPGRGGGGRGFGRGGFTSSLSMMYPMLLNSATVQKDLDLVADQKAKIKEISDKADAARRELFSGMRDLTQEERQAKFAESRKKMEEMGEKTNKEIEGVLLPDQLKRLKAIALQRMGVMALSDKTVQKDLKLTNDQTAKIKSIGEDSMKKMGELFSSGLERDEMREKAQELRKAGEKQVMDVLTADQKTALEKMKGKELKIPNSELRMQGFGGRGGRRGGGGGGGGGNPPPVD
jgi:Spy/CpxP family protein refolding chaperone